MKRTIIITSKTALANFIKERLKQNGHDEKSIFLYKWFPKKFEETEFYIIDERIAQRGFKGEFRTIQKIRRENKNARIIILGNDELSNRMRCRIDGADEYIALQMLTSNLFDSYLTRVVYNNERNRKQL